ncbi:LLM class flavin-dependent oxidoreductase [Kibdelosporangium philippinense]|uniref:LLM class flavin-dependent oxidoreductase n=1 Tax=Kibdelosporangium philippinense TaxID=211113 RepID=A0ABS8ZWQ7_9PSEU|nr:LLM class flavin-dependent oxidoreductase [Kibdelosporangium philippinense]MCE7010818.1 LLM class flavin-dependent oxidoreductase [Kibdelosporangium philippinense]
MSLRYGVYLPPFGPFGDPSVLVDLAVRAEKAGWDGVFLWDHVVTDAMPIVDPWTTLGAIAQATQRIQLGTMVTPLPRRRPWIVARHAGTLSRLSGGRFVLGTGLGSDESGDFSRFGEPSDPRIRSAMYDEGLDVVRAVWSGEAYDHNGPYYQVRLEQTVPEPHRIPVWVGCSTTKPHVLRRAASCDGIFPNPTDHRLTPEELSGILASVGRKIDVAVAGNASLAWEEPIDVDVTGLRQAGMTWWMESLIHFDPLELSMKIVDAGPALAEYRK